MLVILTSKLSPLWTFESVNEIEPKRALEGKIEFSAKDFCVPATGKPFLYHWKSAVPNPKNTGSILICALNVISTLKSEGLSSSGGLISSNVIVVNGEAKFTSVSSLTTSWKLRASPSFVVSYSMSMGCALNW